MAGEVRAIFGESLGLLEESLKSLRRERPDFTSEAARLRWATAMLARSVYLAGSAIQTLYDADVGRVIPGHVRAQFEAAVKLAYLEHYPDKLLDFFDGEPFERYFMAIDRTTLRAELRKQIEFECDEVIKRRPDLLKHEKDAEAIRAGKLKPNYRRLYHKLKLPEVSSMIDQLNRKDPGWTRDLYTVIFRLGSLGPHSSIVALRDAFVEDSAGIAFDISPHYDGAPDYLLQSVNYLLGFVHKIAQRFQKEDADMSERLRDSFEKHQALARRLGALR